MTQNADVLHHLKKTGPLTPMDALTKFGCFRLGARIFELRQDGHEIKTDYVTKNGKTFAKYSMGDAA